MLQLNYTKRVLRICFTFLFIIFSTIFFSKNTVFAAKTVNYYSYKNVYNNLPKANRTEEYLYTEDGKPYICFATYKNNNYKMTVKRTKGVNDYLYCLNYSKHVSFDNKYSSKNNLFNNNLRARLGIAFYYGTTVWKEKADSQFTTGNTILDYYMTQVVVHALIYKYGKAKSDYGINYNDISFKSGTGNLSKKTKAFYKFCCNATVYSGSADFMKSDFEFQKADSPYLYLDQDMLVTPTVYCITNANNSTVKEYTRTVSSSGINANDIAIEEESKQYNSPFRMKFPLSKADTLNPGPHSIQLSEQVIFNRYLAAAWQSTDAEHSSQELGGLLTESLTNQDNISFSLLIGEVVLHKKDSITGENISDAVFLLQQFDDTTGNYIPYKQLTYNAGKQQYESGNIYLSANNKSGKFRLVEERAGQNYINDWDGAVFQITEKAYSFEYNIENQPILGKLTIHKAGEDLQFSDSSFTKADPISLSGIKFGLYAKEDIFLKGTVFYPKDKKIADLITDSSGNASVDSLICGEYYLKEESTHPLYEIDPQIYTFTITRDSNRKYNGCAFQMKNLLKPCRIRVFKYYYAKSDVEQQHKLALQGARFGLYANADILSPNGKTILSKDTFIQDAVTDQDGYLSFDNLPYGDYYIKELEAPADFMLNDGIVTISHEDFNYDDTLKEYSCEKEIVNQKQLFRLRILKTGEAFSSCLEDNCPQGTFFQYQLESVSLQNVEFTLYKKEDDSLVATSITNEQGIAEYTDIEPGDYYVMESAAPEEYQLNTEKFYFECRADNKDYNPLDPPIFESTINNQLCNCNIKLYKSGEHAIIGKEGILYDQIPLSDIVFGIYQDFEYAFPSGNTLPAGSCVGYIVTDQDGNGTLTEKLPIGNYYLKELKTNSGYELDPNIYSFEVKPDHNQDIIIRLDNENQFINQLSKASVQIIKTDANTGKKLKNVEFTLYNEKNEKIGVYKTNKYGKILVEQLPYGKYYFIETKCKNGYYSSNNKYHFELSSSETVTLNITNAPILKLGFDEPYKIGLIGCLVVILCLLIFIGSGYGKSQILSQKKIKDKDTY